MPLCKAHSKCHQRKGHLLVVQERQQIEDNVSARMAELESRLDQQQQKWHDCLGR